MASGLFHSLMSLSNTVMLMIFIVLSYLCSIQILALMSFFLASIHCIHHFRWLVFLGLLIITIVTIAGFVGAYWNRKFILLFHFLCLGGVILLFALLLILMSFVTMPNGNYVVPGREYKEYRLEGFSSWLRNHVTSSSKWGKIRTCLADSHMCAKLSKIYNISAHISPLQSGCCEPPTVCGYMFVNTTLWINPTNVTADPDCYMWSNDQSRLCYGCNACKAGLLGDLRMWWKKLNGSLTLDLLVLVYNYANARIAFNNAQAEGLFQ